MPKIIHGTGADDILSGTDDSEKILAGGGNDTVFAGGGHDTVQGGDGNDEIDGGAGNDDIQGGNGDDSIAGGLGTDSLKGGDGFDTAVYESFPTGVGRGKGNAWLITASGATDELKQFEQVRVDAGDSSYVFALDGSNNAPLAFDDAAATGEDTPLAIAASALLANDYDFEGDPLAITGVGNAQHGAVAIDEGTVSYTPGANFHGADSFSYTITDGHGGSATASVAITVTPVNDPPVAADDAYAMDEDTTLTVATGAGVLANDTDIDSDVLTATVVAGPQHGSLTLQSDGSFAYTPEPDYFGTDTFTYRTDDNAGGSDEADVTISVADVPDIVEILVNQNQPAAGVQSTITGTSNWGQHHGPIAALEDGSIVVGWAAARQAFCQRFTIGGQPVGDPIRLEDVAAAPPTLAALSNGGFVGTWTDYAAGHLGDVVGQVFDADGDPVSGAFLMNVRITNWQTIPFAADLGDDRFVATWVDDVNGIRARVFDYAGTAQTEELPIYSPFGGDYALAGLSDGQFAVAWSHGTWGRWDLYARVFNGDGTPDSDALEVTGTTNNWDRAPVLTTLADGGFVLAWESYSDPTSWDIYAQRYDADGTAQGSAIWVTNEGDATPYAHRLPSVAALKDGGFVVAYGSAGRDGSDWGTYAQMFNSAGEQEGNEFRANETTDGPQRCVGATGLESGGFAVVWEGNGPGDADGVFMRIFDAGFSPADALLT